jgi:hypothetical protein
MSLEDGMEIGLIGNQLRTLPWRSDTFDGNKNVSELVRIETRNGIVVHADDIGLRGVADGFFN